MIRKKVLLNTVDRVRYFVNVASSCDVDIDLISGRYIIDGKSIMGIFGLDLSKPIDMSIPVDEGSNASVDDFLDAIGNFIVG